MDSIQTLPPASDLSPSAISFLNDKLGTEDTFAQASSWVSELQTQCFDLDQALIELNRRFGAGLVAYASFSGQIHGLFSDVSAKLDGLRSSTSSSSTIAGSISLSSDIFSFLY